MPASPRWTPTGLTGVVALTADDDRAFASLADGALLASADGGRRWRQLPAPTLERPTALLSLAGVLLVFHASGLLRLGAEGAGRCASDPAPGLPETEVTAVARWGRAVVAGTHGRGVFRSDDQGGHWIGVNAGLPFGGAGLSVTAVVPAGGALFAAHAFGVSRLDQAGARWEPAGYGLPHRIRRAALAAAGARLFADVDGRLFQLHDHEWTEHSGGGVVLLGADAHALYGASPAGTLLRRPAAGGRWTPFGDGLPNAARDLATSGGWHLATLATGGLWRRPAEPPAPADREPVGEPCLYEVAATPGGRVEVGFWLPTPAWVEIEIFDSGEGEVQRFEPRAYAAGAHRVAVAVAPLPMGLYRCRLTAGPSSVSRSLAVLPLPTPRPHHRASL